MLNSVLIIFNTLFANNWRRFASIGQTLAFREFQSSRFIQIYNHWTQCSSPAVSAKVLPLSDITVKAYV